MFNDKTRTVIIPITVHAVAADFLTTSWVTALVPFKASFDMDNIC
jgi:hypothetical protein